MTFVHFEHLFILSKENGSRNLIHLPGFNFIADRPKAALLFWFFSDSRCGVPLFIVILVIYIYI